MATNLGKIGFTPKGEYNINLIYEEYDVVYSEGSGFVSLVEQNNFLLSDTTKWFKIVGKGEQGIQGETFTFDDLTTAQKEELKGDVIAYNSLSDADKLDLASRVPVSGVIEEGNTQAVSGGEVFDAINGITTITPINLSTPSPEQNGIFQPTEIGIYENFGGLEITQSELESNIVYFYYLDGIFTKQTKGVLTVDEVTPEGLNAVNGKAVFDYTNQTINTIADLRLFNGKEGQIITLLGYYEAGDKEPLNYKWTSEQGVDDGGSVINTNSGSWEAVLNDNNTFVEHFGIFPNRTDLVSFSTNQLNVMIKKNIKCFFNYGTYKFNSDVIIIDETEDIDLIGVGDWDKRWSPYKTTIEVLGNGSFIKVESNTNTRINTSNVWYQGNNRSNNCFYSEKLTNETDFILIAKNVRFHEFNYGFFTDSYSTGCQLDNFVFSDCNVGFWSDLVSNLSKFTYGKLWGNGVGMFCSGFQNYTNQVEVMLNGSTLSPLGVRYGIISNQGTFQNIYSEEYGGLEGMSKETHVFFYDNGNYEPESGLVLDNVSFFKYRVEGDLVATPLLTKSNRFNRIDIRCINDFYLPEFINNSDGLLCEGIVVNGRNNYINQFVNLFNRREFHINVPIIFNDYQFGDGFQGFDIYKSDIESFDLIPVNNSSVVWNEIYSDVYRTVVMGRNSDFILEYDFKLKISNTSGVYALALKGISEIINIDYCSVITHNSEYFLIFKGVKKMSYNSLRFGNLLIGFQTNVPSVISASGFINIKNI